MKNIRIRFVEADGRTGYINRFSGENSDAAFGADERRFAALKSRAIAMAAKWSEIYPETKIMVVEERL